MPTEWSTTISCCIQVLVPLCVSYVSKLNIDVFQTSGNMLFQPVVTLGQPDIDHEEVVSSPEKAKQEIKCNYCEFKTVHKYSLGLLNKCLSFDPSSSFRV